MSAEVNLMEPPLDMHCYLELQRGWRERGSRGVDGRTERFNFYHFQETLRQVNPIRSTNRCYQALLSEQQPSGSSVSLVLN